jgi:4-amino-4-deoxychorismate lyase
MMQRGLIVEGSRSNVFCVANDVLITPSLSQGGVRGIMRQHIIKHAIKLGIEVRIRDIGISTLQRAEEVFVCNSVFGLWPVKKIECMHKSIGPVSRLLQREFDTYFYV